MNKIGAFCETYGNTISNRILEYLMENDGLDFAVGDMARDLKISKPKAYEIMYSFEKKGYAKESRMVGKTQLYLLNRENQRVKLFLRDFKECIRIIAEEYSDAKKHGLRADFLGRINAAQKHRSTRTGGFARKCGLSQHATA